MDNRIDRTVQDHPDLLKRKTILSGIAASAGIAAAPQARSELSCACLPEPKCDDVCAYGGTPKADGTQACECNDPPPPSSIGLLDAYPVGSVYMSVGATNPAELFGGTWDALNEGRILIGAGTKYPVGSKGGEANHQLTTSELPGHTHSGRTPSGGSHTHGSGWGEHTSTGTPANGWYNTSNNQFGQSGERDSDNSQTKTTSSGSHSHSVSIGYTGGGSSHNNMAPYISVYMWLRTA